MVEVLHEGITCRVVVLLDASDHPEAFELQDLDGHLLGKYPYVTDALQEADAYDRAKLLAYTHQENLNERHLG